MLVVKVELWPYGFESAAREIGRMTIANDGTSERRDRGSYDVKIMRKNTTDVVQQEKRVEDYPRLSYSVWELVKRALA